MQGEGYSPILTLAKLQHKQPAHSECIVLSTRSSARWQGKCIINIKINKLSGLLALRLLAQVHAASLKKNINFLYTRNQVLKIFVGIIFFVYYKS